MDAILGHRPATQPTIVVNSMDETAGDTTGDNADKLTGDAAGDTASEEVCVCVIINLSPFSLSLFLFLSLERKLS